MSEREHGIAREPETRIDDAVVSVDEGRAVVAERMNEAARRARFLEALDHVMTKHRNVLAALAK